MSDSPLPDFWPTDVQHSIAYAQLAPAPKGLREPILKLAAQSDALRALQLADGSMLDDGSAVELRRSMAYGLRALGQEVDPASRERLSLTADGLIGCKRTPELLADCDPEPALDIICGPLGTWRPKTREPLHSFVAAGHYQDGQERLNGLDDALEAATASLGLGLLPPEKLAMHVTNLMASGGEAAGHPKHFAYFLPEDEGIDDAPLSKQRTLYMDNVHLARFPAITVPIGEGMLAGEMPVGEAEPRRTLMSWIRGHDHGHGIVLPATDYHWRDQLGIEPFMALQELIADTFAFLLCISEPWLKLTGATRAEFCAIQLAECLHYMRRGPRFYGDAGAMYMEVGFLADHGHIEVSPKGRIHWTEQGLINGMWHLAETLIKVLLEATDERPAGGLST